MISDGERAKCQYTNMIVNSKPVPRCLWPSIQTTFPSPRDDELPRDLPSDADAPIYTSNASACSYIAAEIAGLGHLWLPDCASGWPHNTSAKHQPRRWDNSGRECSHSAQHSSSCEPLRPPSREPRACQHYPPCTIVRSLSARQAVTGSPCLGAAGRYTQSRKPWEHVE